MSMKLILRTTNWKNQRPPILLPGEAGVPSVDHVAPTCKNKWQMLIFLSEPSGPCNPLSRFAPLA
ncbi:hypothetical protein ACFPRL_05705 [Pseudoclavibacter helvolus]